MLKPLAAFLVGCSAIAGPGLELFPPARRVSVANLGFLDANGQKSTVADHKGKVVLVDFWTIWCGPCKRSLPELRALQAEGNQKQDLVVIPCNLDEEFWPMGVQQFMAKNQKVLNGFRYYRPQFGAHGIATVLGADIQSFPTTLLIDREGRLAARWSGYAEGLAVKLLNPLLAETP